MPCCLTAHVSLLWKFPVWWVIMSIPLHNLILLGFRSWGPPTLFLSLLLPPFLLSSSLAIILHFVMRILSLSLPPFLWLQISYWCPNWCWLLILHSLNYPTINLPLSLFPLLFFLFLIPILFVSDKAFFGAKWRSVIMKRLLFYLLIFVVEEITFEQWWHKHVDDIVGDVLEWCVMVTCWSDVA